MWIFKPAEPKRVLRFEYVLPEGRLFSRNTAGEVQYGLAVSPDGGRFVYTAADGLYLRDMDTLEARHIAGTDNGSLQPFFSPDGKWIGYFSQSDMKLKKVGVSGGAPIVLCDIPVQMAGASWNTDDTIVFSEKMSGVMRVSCNGGTPETLIEASIVGIVKDGFPLAPILLPDGDTLMLTNLTSTDIADSQIVLQSLRSGEQKVLLNGAYASYQPTGHIVYGLVKKGIGNVYAVPFDLDKLELTGGSVSMHEGVRVIAISDSGTLVYVPGPTSAPGTTGAASSGNTLVWVDREGKEESLGAEPKNYVELKISPDGDKVALTILDASNTDIWIWDISRQTPTRLIFNKLAPQSPVWTPDSEWIVFFTAHDGFLGGIYRKSADGVGEVELLGAKPDRAVLPQSFFPRREIPGDKRIDLYPSKLRYRDDVDGRRPGYEHPAQREFQ